LNYNPLIASAFTGNRQTPSPSLGEAKDEPAPPVRDTSVQVDLIGVTS